MDRSMAPPRSSSMASPSDDRSRSAQEPVPQGLTDIGTSRQKLKRADSEDNQGLALTRSHQSSIAGSALHERPRIAPRILITSRGETWKDFLRETGEARGGLSRVMSSNDALRQNNAESSRPEDTLHRTRSQGATLSSVGRKRFPSNSSEHGYGNKRPYGVPTPTLPVAASGSAMNPIDLSISPPQRQMTIPRDAARSPSSSSIIVPPWQPDSEVNECPVCSTPFTLFYRKHHCRKCGRVVCANCSPHRITIPRQFIVQPPPPPAVSPFLGVFGIPESHPPQHSPSSDDALSLIRTPSSLRFGGETVRVCNPCVPDPNLSPPPQMPQPGSSVVPPHGFIPLGLSSRPAGQSPNFSLQQPPSYRSQVSPIASQPPAQQSPNPPLLPSSFPQRERIVSQSHHNHAAALLHARQASLAAAAGQRPSLPGRLIPHHHPAFTNLQGHRRSASAAISVPGHTLPYNPNAPLPPLPHTELEALRRPHRIREGDECPVCGRELPPKDQDDDETARERHIEDCIRMYSAPSSSSVPNHPRQNSAPVIVPVTTASSSSRPLGPAIPSGSESVIARVTSGLLDEQMALHAQRPQQHRMLLYHATEKDCVGEDGDRSECVICFEEFEEGDEMARLDCLCKFHRVSPIYLALSLLTIRVVFN